MKYIALALALMACGAPDASPTVTEKPTPPEAQPASSHEEKTALQPKTKEPATIAADPSPSATDHPTTKPTPPEPVVAAKVQPAPSKPAPVVAPKAEPVPTPAPTVETKATTPKTEVIPEPIVEPEPLNPLTQFDQSADAVFKRFVRAGRVNYTGFRGARSTWQPLLESVEDLDISGYSRNERRSFWLNYYNLRTMAQVVDAGSISSPLDVSGFFDGKRSKVAGKNLTLNEIENRYLRPDPRVHFALVCAAKGCPSIQPRAYTSNRVSAELNAATRRAMNNTSWLKVNGKKVELSEIFKWYADDFGGTTGLIPFINKYRSEPLPENAEISYYPYDWTLNKQ